MKLPAGLNSSEAYFQACWLTLKAIRPRLAKQMDDIELKVFGIEVTKKAKIKKKDVDNKQKPVVV